MQATRTDSPHSLDLERGQLFHAFQMLWRYIGQGSSMEAILFNSLVTQIILLKYLDTWYVDLHVYSCAHPSKC